MSQSVVLQMKHFDAVCEKLVCSTYKHVRMYGCKVALMLLRYQPEACISVLLRRVGLRDFALSVMV